MFMRLLASAAWLITHFFPRTDSNCLLLRWILTPKSCPPGVFRSGVEAARKSVGLPTVHAFPAPGLRKESGCTSPQELTNFISGGSVFTAEMKFVSSCGEVHPLSVRRPGAGNA